MSNSSILDRLHPRAKQQVDNAHQASFGVMTNVLRIAVSIVFIWFGLLKIMGDSPVVGLLESTFPWANSHALLLVIGSAEVVIGLAMLIPKLALPALLIAAAHLMGTFVTFLLVPGIMFQHRNPLLLSTEGEFVFKNVILISAVLLLVCILIKPKVVCEECGD